MVAAITAEPEVGRTYEGPVKSTTAFGAPSSRSCPASKGLLHISELQHGRTEKTEDVVKKGDIVQVKLLEVDERGRMKLSRKALLPKGAKRLRGNGSTRRGAVQRPSRPTGWWSSPRSCRACARRRSGSRSARPAPTSRPTSWASPTCSSTWCSRAPSAERPGARARAGGPRREPRRLHRARLHQLPGPRPRRGPAAGGRRPHRPGAPALLRESDLEPERNVVLEEINGVADTPDDLVFELPRRALWPDHPYGYSILGTPETLAALGRATSRRCIGRATTAATA